MAQVEAFSLLTDFDINLFKAGKHSKNNEVASSGLYETFISFTIR